MKRKGDASKRAKIFQFGKSQPTNAAKHIPTAQNQKDKADIKDLLFTARISTTETKYCFNKLIYCSKKIK